MKHHLINLFVGIFLFISCTQDEILNHAVEQPIGTRTVEETAQVDDYKVSYSLLQKYLKLTKKDVDVQQITPLVREGDTLAYAVQYTEGWDVIAADQRLTPVMALSEEGNFSQPLTSPIESVLDYIQGMRSSTEDVKNGLWKFLSPTPRTDRAMTRGGDYGNGMWIMLDTIYDSGSTSIPHLLQTQWGQGSPWNQYTPNVNNQRTILGCTTVATGQVIYYFCHNKTGNTNIPVSATSATGANGDPTFSQVFYNSWPSMARNSTEAYTENTALFLGYLGEKMGVDWGVNATSGTVDNIIAGLEEYEMKRTYTNNYVQNFDVIYSNIKSGKPVLVAANNHAFVIDRYYESYVYSYYTCRWDEGHEITEWEYYNLPQEMFESPGWHDDNKEAYKEVVIYSAEDNYIGMNWGWEGLNDNSFYAARHYVAPYTDEAGYSPGVNAVYNPNWSTVGGTFNDVKHIFYNISAQ